MYTNHIYTQLRAVGVELMEKVWRAADQQEAMLYFNVTWPTLPTDLCSNWTSKEVDLLLILSLYLLLPTDIASEGCLSIFALICEVQNWFWLVAISFFNCVC